MTATRAVSAYGWSYGFTGRLYDPETGLWLFRHRYFDPGLGRFIRRDPKGYVDGSSLYNGYFVGNGVDPSGLDWEWVPDPVFPSLLPGSSSANAAVSPGIGYFRGYWRFIPGSDIRTPLPLVSPQQLMAIGYKALPKNANGREIMTWDYWRDEASKMPYRAGWVMPGNRDFDQNYDRNPYVTQSSVYLSLMEFFSKRDQFQFDDDIIKEIEMTGKDGMRAHALATMAALVIGFPGTENWEYGLPLDHKIEGAFRSHKIKVTANSVVMDGLLIMAGPPIPLRVPPSGSLGWRPIQSVPYPSAAKTIPGNNTMTLTDDALIILNKNSPEVVLQTLTNRAAERLGTNPRLAREVLSEAEYAAAQGSARIGAMQFGNAVERMVARDIRRIPGLDQVLLPVGGAGRPDFVGLGLWHGATFDVTTFGQVPTKFPGGVPKYPNLTVIPYLRPGGVVPLP